MGLKNTLFPLEAQSTRNGIFCLYSCSALLPAASDNAKHSSGRAGEDRIECEVKELTRGAGWRNPSAWVFPTDLVTVINIPANWYGSSSGESHKSWLLIYISNIPNWSHTSNETAWPLFSGATSRPEIRPNIASKTVAVSVLLSRLKTGKRNVYRRGIMEKSHWSA